MSTQRKREMKPISFQKGIILEKEKLSGSTFWLKIRPGTAFSWIPGQFIITKNTINGEELIADYTIINTEGPEFEIIVENHKNSKIGKYLDTLGLGESFIFKAPRGRFYLEPENESCVFIFRNIGITAALPLLQALKEQTFQGSITIYNFLTEDFEEIMKGKIDSLSSVLRIEYLTDFSLEEERMNSGKLLKKDMIRLFGMHDQATFYISGVSEFNKNIRQRLINIGIPKSKIFREMFG